MSLRIKLLQEVAHEERLAGANRPGDPEDSYFWSALLREALLEPMVLVLFDAFGEPGGATCSGGECDNVGANFRETQHLVKFL